MKKAIILLITVLLIPVLSFTQTLENLEFVAPFSDDLAAIKKEGQWGFINKQGDVVVSFRSDLVSSKNDDGSYPVFYNNRCLIAEKKEGITYFGFIDKTGETVIEPQFLNATSFINGLALVLELRKKEVGKNDILNKNIVFYKYYEVTLDTNGNILNYLNPKGVNIVVDKKYLSKPPIINSKLISNSLATIKTNNKKVSIIKLN
jgi:hypothetical protein